jgi:hypothetical protein
MARILIVSIVLTVCAAACGQSGGGAEPPPPAAPSAVAQPPAVAPQSAEPSKPAPPPSERVDDPTFEVAAKPAGPYATGKLSSFAVSLKPRGEYHINQDYPMSIAVAASPELEFPKPKLGKPEAAEFGEQLARFDVPFTAKAAGAHKVEAKVRFAVCTPENCVPDERTLAVVLPVE